jgi:hypothetical protein
MFATKMHTMKRIFFCLAGMLCTLALAAQEIRLTVNTSSDTLLAGHLVQITYNIENADLSGFVPPDFKGLTLVNGPQQSSSMQSINGVVRREASLSYLFAAEQAGKIVLEPAQLKTKGKVISSPRRTIHVLPNPGEKPDPRFPGWQRRQAPPEPQDSIQHILRRGRKTHRL